MSGSTHTFLFTDLVGFTALTAAEGDDRAAEVALALAEAVQPLLEEHRAELVKALGDGLMIHCEDPRCAVELGTQIVERTRALSGMPPVRVGIHTGSAVGRDGDWYGAAVNVAARLCTAAGGDEVLVSDATSEAAGRVRAVELGEPRLHWLRNVTEPVSARLAERRHECRLGRHGRLVRFGRLAERVA